MLGANNTNIANLYFPYFDQITIKRTTTTLMKVEFDNNQEEIDEAGDFQEDSGDLQNRKLNKSIAYNSMNKQVGKKVAKGQRAKKVDRPSNTGVLFKSQKKRNTMPKRPAILGESCEIVPRKQNGAISNLGKRQEEQVQIANNSSVAAFFDFYRAEREERRREAEAEREERRKEAERLDQRLKAEREERRLKAVRLEWKLEAEREERKQERTALLERIDNLIRIVSGQRNQADEGGNSVSSNLSRSNGQRNRR